MVERSPLVTTSSPATPHDHLNSRYSLSHAPGSRISPHKQVRQLFSINGNSPGRFSAPAPDVSSSDESDGPEPVPSFSLQAPSGVSDSDTDDESIVQSRRRSSIGASVRPVSAYEVALAETTSRLSQQLQLKAQRRVSDFQRQLLEIETQERIAAETAVQRCQQEMNALAATDRQLEARRAQDREQLISSLRTVHERQAEQAARTVAELEAAVQKEAEARERAAAEKAQREAQLKAEQEAEEQAKAKAQEQAQKKAEADKVAAEVAAAVAATKPSKDSLAGSNKHGIVSVAQSAVKLQQHCAERLASAKETVRPFVEDRAMRDIKRSIDKFVTLNVQQISATLEQVRQKSQALVGFISQHHDIQRTYALITLAGKLMSQCEVQITRLHSFAFPLAEVAVAVAAAHPDFVDLLLARLHDACPLAIPMYYGFRSGGDELEYLRLMKYKITEDEEKGKVVMTKESTDEYMGRMQGYVMLYAAITQSDNPANPHGLQHAWEYLARLLNALPANRLTAAALNAFLKVAGYKMAGVYKGQFMKLLTGINGFFLAELGQTNDPDARAVATRLQTYLNTQAFTKPPEGRTMPEFDASSYDRA